MQPCDEPHVFKMAAVLMEAGKTYHMVETEPGRLRIVEVVLDEESTMRIAKPDYGYPRPSRWASFTDQEIAWLVDAVGAGVGEGLLPATTSFDGDPPADSEVVNEFLLFQARLEAEHAARLEQTNA